MRPLDRRKPFALVVVLGAHVLFVVVVVWQTRVRLASRPGDQFVSVMMIIAPERPVNQPQALQPRLTSAPPSAFTVSPPAVEYSAADDSSTAPVVLPQEAPVRAGIDWLGEARRTARNLSPTEAEKLREAERRNAELHSATPLMAQHYYGEEEASKDRTREWLSDHCYVESEKPPLGAPPRLAKVLSGQKFGCIEPSPGWFSGELFKGLNAYKREHDLEPAMKAAVRSGAAQPARSAPNEGLTGPPGLMTPGNGTAGTGGVEPGQPQNIPMPHPGLDGGSGAGVK